MKSVGVPPNHLRLPQPSLPRVSPPLGRMPRGVVLPFGLLWQNMLKHSRRCCGEGEGSGGRSWHSYELLVRACRNPALNLFRLDFGGSSNRGSCERVSAAKHFVFLAALFSFPFCSATTSFASQLTFSTRGSSVHWFTRCRSSQRIPTTCRQ